jgi:kynurenine formamidase
MIDSTRIGRSVDREVGLIGRLGPESVLAALGIVREGRVYDLDSTRWHHMPVASGHPAFQVLTYRSAAGLRNEGDLDWLEEGNSVQLSVISDLVMGTIHSGTHIDSLSHVCCGPNAEWFGGFSAYKDLGDFGPLACDAITIPPIITRGILVDVAAHLGEPLLPKGYAITTNDIEGALERQGVSIRPNDAVLIRTGYMSVWPDSERAPQYFGAGVDHTAAVFIAESGAVLVAGDTEGFEVHPSIDPENPLPVHLELLIKRGIHIMELVNMEQLAKDSVYEFCFITLPLPIRGATGSMTRPIALC